MSYRTKAFRRRELKQLVPVYMGPGVSFFMSYRSYLELPPGARLGIEPIMFPIIETGGCRTDQDKVGGE